MNGFPSRATVERVRREYPAGTRVELVSMDDRQAPPLGTKGTVRFVDDAGTVHIAWDNGSSLGACLEEDVIRKLDSVTVVCYGQTEVWDSRSEAAAFYLEGMAATEGAEKERYATIYVKLIQGLDYCTDGDD